MSQLLLFAGLGLAAGVLFAGIALGVVTTFKATGVVNFAQVGFGMWGAFTFARLRQDGQLVLPIPGITNPSLGGKATVITALVIALLMSALMGAVSYLLVFRPLRNASTVSNLVASTGLLLVIQSLIVLQFGTSAVPVDPFLPQGTVNLLGAALPTERLAAAGITIVVALALAAGFRWTRIGLALRGASESQLNVSLAKWSPDVLALIGWSLGAIITAFLSILVAPSVNLSPVAFGLLVVPGLAAALVGRLSSVMAACFGGLALGVIQSVITNWSTRDWWPEWARVGVAQLVPFLAVVGVLLFLGSKLPFRGDPMGARLPLASTRRPRPLAVIVLIALGGLALVVTSGTYRFGLMTSMALGLFFLSVIVLTGFAGQLSLGQAAIAGIGGFALAKLGTGIPFPINLLLAATLAAVAGVLIGAPALRIRGAQFAIVSMAGAVALESLLFKNPSFTAQAGEPIAPASIFGLDLAVRQGNDIARLAAGLMILVIVAAATWATACIVAGRTGRRFLAIRSDERAAAAAGVNVEGTKLIAAATAAFLAGLAGGMLGLLRGQLTADSFTLFVGITAVAFATNAGITRVSGSLVAGFLGTGGVLFVFLDDHVNFGKWYGLAFGIALVLTVITRPSGITGDMAERIETLKSRRKAKRGPGDEEITPTVSRIAPAFPAGRGARLDVQDLWIAYDGVVAVNNATFTVEPGEVLGLVGPNGAGKTSLLDGICGFVPTRGVVRLDDQRLDGQPPHERKAAGIGRTWQDGGLFDDLSVLDNLAITAEGGRRWDVARDLLTTSAVDRDELVAELARWGLQDVADRRPTELSIGQRKLVGLARATAGNPLVLLADEPAAGLDSWESEELGRRLRAYADSGHAVLVIEHDLPLVRRISDRLIVLDFGRVLAVGEPDEVLAHPQVAAAYLGVEQASEADVAVVEEVSR